MPLQDQGVLGAGLKRKRVTFIPAASTSTVQHTSSLAVSAANKYLSIVLKDSPGDTFHSNSRRTAISSIASASSLEEP